MIRVMHVIGSLDRGGAEQILFSIVKLHAGRVQHTVLSLTKSDEQQSLIEELRAAGAEVICVKLREKSKKSGSFQSLIRVLNGLLQVFKLIKSRQPDILNSWFYQSDLICGLIGRILNIPVVWGIFLSNLNPKYYKRNTIWAMRVAGWCSKIFPSSIISCTQEGTRSHLAIGYPKRKINYIPPGIDTTVFSPSGKQKERIRIKISGENPEYVVGMVARFDPQKNFDLLFSGFSAFVADTKKSNIKLWLAGGYGIEEENKYFKDLEERHNIKGKVMYFGRVEHIEQFYKCLDIFVLVSHGEGLPVSVCEAMSSGIPCIASNVGDMSKLINDRNGYLLNDETPIHLAKKLMKIYSCSAKTILDIGEEARKIIVDDFSATRAADEYFYLYSGLLRNKNDE